MPGRLRSVQIYCNGQERRLPSGRIDFGKKGFAWQYTPQLTAVGKLDFGQLWPLKYDIMGPFALVPFMECRHSVWSMRHTVTGNVWISGQGYSYGGYALYPGQSGIGGSAVGGI